MGEKCRSSKTSRSSVSCWSGVGDRGGACRNCDERVDWHIDLVSCNWLGRGFCERRASDPYPETVSVLLGRRTRERMKHAEEDFASAVNAVVSAVHGRPLSRYILSASV